jgi:hypothetical protein
MLWALAADVKDIRYIYIWSAVMVAMLLAAFGAYSYLKRWMNQEEVSSGGGFTLSDLRKLHEQGKISDQEYELTRANMLKSAKAAADRMPEVLPRRKRVEERE